MVNRYMKRCLASLVIGEMQIFLNHNEIFFDNLVDKMKMSNNTEGWRGYDILCKISRE